MHNADEYRTEATALVRALHSESKATRLRAAKRLGILDDAVRDELTQALGVVAHEAGFNSWEDLESASAHAPVVFDTKRLFGARTDVFLNLWFHSYEEALAVFRSQPTKFLFPHGTQFVLCDSDFLRWIGVDPADEDWARAGHNWHEPDDLKARERLALRLHLALKVP